MATYTVEQQVQQIYIGLLGRAADKPGLDYWTNEIESGVLSIEQLRSNIVNEQPEYATGLGTLTRAQVVSELYQNLFERAPEAAGLEYWVNGGGSTVNIDQLVLALSDGAGANDRLVMENKTEAATYYSTQAGADFTRDAAKSAVEDVDGTRQSVLDSKAATDSETQSAGQTYTLTTSVDDIQGTVNNDTIKGVLSTVAANNTLSALDSIDGGAGNDVLSILDESGGQVVPASLQLTSIETVNVRSAGATSVDTSGAGFSSVTAVNVTQAAAAAAITGSAAQDLSVAGVAGAITVDGGKDVTITDATANQTITVGATTQAAGTVSVTDSKQGTADIVVDGGTDVIVNSTITATTAAVSGGDVVVGATNQASGTSTVVQNLVSNGGSAEAHDLTSADIAVTGGTSIDITVNATSTAQNESADGDIAIGTVAATADATTTTVSAVQNATATTFTKAAVDVVKESSVVTFKAMTSGQTLIVNGLTFTSVKDLTAAEAAQAFSNIAEGGTVGGAGTAEGFYTGTFNTAVWSSAAANGTTVTFTAQDDSEADLAFTGSATAPAQVKTAGTVAAAADTSANVVTYGAATINDNATAASLTTVTVDGYATGSTIGGTNATTKLANLNLANAAAGATMAVADTADALALSVKSLGTSAADAVVTLTAAPKTLNVTSTGNNFVNLTAAATEALNVSGTGTLDADATDLAALETVTVTGAAGLKLNSGVADTVTSVDASATSGNVTLSIDGTKATYAGSTGSDTVSLATGTALTKAIDLGAGNDTLVFGVAVTGSTAALNGGDGIDTLSMTVANAATLDATAQTFYTNFERLTLNDVFGTSDAIVDAETINLANLGFTNYVTTSGTNQLGGATDTLTLDKLASNGTVVLTAQGDIVVNVTDAAIGTADVLNVEATTAVAALDAGTLTAANVETINLTATDSQLDNDNDGKDDAVEAIDLILTGDKATSVVLDGNADLTLTLTGSSKVTTINASAMTGDLDVTSVNSTSATTITGGAGDDIIKGAAAQDVLIGGAGNDRLEAGGELTTLTGGAGNDTFVLNTPATVNGYATITDLSAGDLIDTSATAFSNAKVTLADTAVFQDYANAAVNSVGVGGATWFQFSGNTYLAVDAGADSSSFTNATDQIIKITGLVDLGDAAFNTDTGDLTIA